MTIDERLQFLLQSTESLHATVQEQASNINLLIQATRENTANINSLARIAEAHEHRLDDLEG